MRVKLTYVISDLANSIQFEWVAIELAKRYNITFILIGPPGTPFEIFLRRNNIEVFFINNRNTRFAFLWFKVFKVLILERPQIVHAHLWRATLIAMSASWLLRIPRRIFTRHHGTIHYIQYPSGRKWDRLCNALATDIVAISGNVKQILVNMDQADERKITVIRHGFKLDHFKNVAIERRSLLANKYKIPIKGKKIGVISRYIELKGIEYIIDAFADLRKQFPDTHLILVNASGDYENQIRAKLESLPPGSFTEIVFEQDVAGLYALFDVFVHVPVDAQAEAFGQIYVEALAAERPCVFTLSGIASEFVEHEVNAMVVPHRNTREIGRAISRLLYDERLAQTIASRGSISVSQFNITHMIDKLQALYE
jgi:glycosyltransferase involved in cell wall biosynthesis